MLECDVTALLPAYEQIISSPAQAGTGGSENRHVFRTEERSDAERSTQRLQQPVSRRAWRAPPSLETVGDVIRVHPREAKLSSNR
jgi:hypothetical protein